VDFAVEEYSGASCATLVTTNYIFQNSDVAGGSWVEYGATFTTGGTTVSCKMIVLSDSASDILADMFSLKLGTYRTPWVENPTGAGTTTYNTRNYRFDNPLQRWSDADAEYGWENGFCVAKWVYTDWNSLAAGTAYFFQAIGTVGNNNAWWFSFTATELLQFRVYDAAASTRFSQYGAVTDTDWTAGDWKYIEGCTDNTGTIVAHHYNRANTTWYVWSAPSGPGTGIQDGAGTENVVGGTGTTNGYFSEVRISPYPAGAFAWPNAGFNNGEPPVNGYGSTKRPY